MTQPPEGPAPLYDSPAANVAREQALSVYATYEPVLYQAYLDMITGWLGEVSAAVVNQGVTSLALMPDPLTVFAKAPQWTKLVDTYTETVVRHVLAEAYHTVLGEGDDTIFATRPFVHRFIEDAANKMTNTPTEVYGVVSKLVDAAVTNGASIPDLAAQIQQALSVTGTDTWKNRAETVARTEIHAAYVGGRYDAYAMIVEADPGTQWVKRWLSAEDERTRPTHREADGQAVPFSTPFRVGDADLLFPGDPTGPPGEVINCRCDMLLEEAGQPTDLTNRQMKASLAAEAVNWWK